MTAHTEPLSILVCALGGEGGGVLSEWLVEAALQSGYPVQSTSIPGVAQRTGATTYYIEIFPVPQAQLDGRRPVLSLYPVPGALDLLVSSELLETARQVGLGLATPQRTRIISSTARALTTHERMQLGDGRLDTHALAQAVRLHSREHHLFDMSAIARQTGTVVSAVMFGAISGSGLLPFPREACEKVIRAGGKGAAASLDGFARAFDAVASSRRTVELVQQIVGQAAAPAPASHALPADIAARFPPPTHDLLALGHARLLDYQDRAYGALYLERLTRVLEAERRSDPQGRGGWAITRECGRFLALWMAFDDIVRVADLKSRASRRARVRSEVQAGEAELLHVYEHFKPGVPEIAALLPEGMAGALRRWDDKRQARGCEAFAMPLKLATHSVGGLFALRVLSALRGLRRHGQRFAQEQAQIERWLQAIDDGTREDWTLGHEIALCGRLIKGYGSTNERGKANLLHVVEHLAGSASLGTPVQRAQAVRSARNAALSDEAGTALDQTLRDHGAPPRPPVIAPIRFVRPAKAHSRV